MTNWTATLLDGAIGGAVGGLSSFLAAAWVIRRQSASDRQLLKAQVEATRRSVAEERLTSVAEMLMQFGRPHEDFMRVLKQASLTIFAVRVTSLQTLSEPQRDELAKVTTALDDIHEELKTKPDMGEGVHRLMLGATIRLFNVLSDLHSPMEFTPIDDEEIDKRFSQVIPPSST